ncbi:hypothetical protein CR201_G0044817 [Pongo abelii]|uniref:Uncharacterized protein n=1 Tax=Pongo abelii TaxID=9601 RepID=A0A2J8S9U1_PONAB|nr:hypothetical protein CR201_G0044817 [Pongo abelii]
MENPYVDLPTWTFQQEAIKRSKSDSTLSVNNKSRFKKDRKSVGTVCCSLVSGDEAGGLGDSCGDTAQKIRSWQKRLAGTR